MAVLTYAVDLHKAQAVAIPTASAQLDPELSNRLTQIDELLTQALETV
jgi:hypothetical protein